MIPFNIADSSVADDRNIVNRAIGQPAGARPESLVIGRFEVGTDMLNNSQGHNFAMIWEIILRDFWGAILRDLLTRALNLRPIAVHKGPIIYD